MSDVADLIRWIQDLEHRLEEERHIRANMVRVGTVQKADAEKGYQVTFAEEDGKPIPSAWFPHPEDGGTRKTWRPMPEGQIVYAICPNGDQKQGFIIPRGGFSDQNKAPSDKLDEEVETWGDKFKKVTNKDGVTYSYGDKISRHFGKNGIVDTVDGVVVTHTKDGIVEKTDGAQRELTAAGTTFKDGAVRHDESNIGKSHVHLGVEPGIGKTGNPDV